MQSEGSFKIGAKLVQNVSNNPVQKYQQITITIQKQGSVALTHKGAIGKNQFTSHLENILLQMHQGDRWQLITENNSSFIVQIIEIGNSVDSRNHFDLAQALKAQGNALIKQKQNKKALEKYSQAYNLVVNDPSTKAHELKLTLISNLALASLNITEYRSAINWCNQHLQQTLEPNLKIVYRKANANKGLKNWLQARKDIEFGIANSSNDAQSLDNFKKLLVVLQKQQRQQQKKEKAVYGKMFG